MQRDVNAPEQARRFWFPVVIFVALALLLAACGSSGSSSGSGGYTTGGTTPTTSTNTSQNTTPTSSGSGYGGNNYGGGKTPTASSSNDLIKTATVTVSGKSETILTDAKGLTLYYRTSDKPPSNVCSGGCASAWPPILTSGSGAPTSSSSLPGKLTAVTDANGNQVEYNGHLLYTYAGDTSAGQTTGEGVGGVWFVVTPGLA